MLPASELEDVLIQFRTLPTLHSKTVSSLQQCWNDPPTERLREKNKTKRETVIKKQYKSNVNIIPGMCTFSTLSALLSVFIFQSFKVQAVLHVHGRFCYIFWCSRATLFWNSLLYFITEMTQLDDSGNSDDTKWCDDADGIDLVCTECLFVNYNNTIAHPM